MTGLDLPTLRRFVELAGERLRGEWVILGGTVVPLLGGRHRVTADIDVAPPSGATTEELNELLRIARDLGLPVESVNPAASLFVQTVEGWRDLLVRLHRGPSATILVPNATLYVLTKIDRLTEADLDDCLERLRLGRSARETIDAPRLRAAIDERLAAAPTPPRRQRLTRVRAAL